MFQLETRICRLFLWTPYIQSIDSVCPYQYWPPRSSPCSISIDGDLSISSLYHPCGSHRSILPFCHPSPVNRHQEIDGTQKKRTRTWIHFRSLLDSTIYNISSIWLGTVSDYSIQTSQNKWDNISILLFLPYDTVRWSVEIISQKYRLPFCVYRMILLNASSQQSLYISPYISLIICSPHYYINIWLGIETGPCCLSVSQIIQYWHLKINDTISGFYSDPLSSILEYTTQFGV